MAMVKVSSLGIALGIASGLALAVVARAGVHGNTNSAQAAGGAANSSSSSSSSSSLSSSGSQSTEVSPVAIDSAKPIVERVCQSCHDIGVLSQTPHTADEWPAIVQRMRSNGADLNSADAKLVVLYLQKNYVAKP